MDDDPHIEFAPSAARHRIGRERVRFVIGHCQGPLYVPDADRDDADLVLFLGPDSNGVPLEIGAIEAEDGGLVVIHAMRLRPKYRDDYLRAIGGRP
jgi:hypothetical protein